VLFELSGDWTIPLVALIVLCVPQLVFGVLVSRPSYIEDEIAARDEQQPVTRR
jgi:MFS transporter, CP family, cyanate transporter